MLAAARCLDTLETKIKKKDLSEFVIGLTPDSALQKPIQISPSTDIHHFIVGYIKEISLVTQVQDIAASLPTTSSTISIYSKR